MDQRLDSRRSRIASIRSSDSLASGRFGCAQAEHQHLFPGEPDERPIVAEPRANKAVKTVEHDMAVVAADRRQHRLGLLQAIGMGSLVPGEVIHVRRRLADISRVHHA